MGTIEMSFDTILSQLKSKFEELKAQCEEEQVLRSRLESENDGLRSQLNELMTGRVLAAGGDRLEAVAFDEEGCFGNQDLAISAHAELDRPSIETSQMETQQQGLRHLQDLETHPESNAIDGEHAQLASEEREGLNRQTNRSSGPGRLSESSEASHAAARRDLRSSCGPQYIPRGSGTAGNHRQSVRAVYNPIGRPVPPPTPHPKKVLSRLSSRLSHILSDNSDSAPSEFTKDIWVYANEARRNSLDAQAMTHQRSNDSRYESAGMRSGTEEGENGHDEEVRQSEYTAGREGGPSVVHVFSSDPPKRPSQHGKSGQLRQSNTRELAEIFDAHERFKGRRTRSKTMINMWALLTDPDSSAFARRYRKCFNPIVVVSVLISLQDLWEFELLPESVKIYSEVFFELFFVFDLMLRFASTPNRRVFVTEFYNLIDLITCLPLAVHFQMLSDSTFQKRIQGEGAYRKIFPLRSVSQEDDWLFAQQIFLTTIPIFRILKLLRRFEDIHLVKVAFQEALVALPVLIYTLFFLCMLFATLIAYTEPEEQIENFWHAMWLTIVTMMTIGYGDTYPITKPGQLIVTCLIITSALYMAMPLGIIGNAFNRSWERRKELLVQKRTRERIIQWGYSPIDIPALFTIFDPLCRGELGYRDFKRMIEMMKIGLTEKHIRQLFATFDQDGSGTVDDAEFVKGIFPDSYYEVYGGDIEDDDEDYYDERDD